ncbi:phage holin family protein [Novosphingobium sp.]|uniref:phage holin family protein n=1 Tax=Novosphingobium sp. TaxID=1874826 RepID=UPI0025DF5BE5|nr:phage holin family protein [Novosphingobium sp.]
MADDQTQDVTESTKLASQRSLIEDVRVLVEDGRTLVEAEVAYQKSRASVAGAGAKGVIAWGALAAALVFFLLMAIVLGVLIGLAGVVGPWASTAIMVTSLGILAAFSAQIASRRWKNTAQLLSEKDDTP